MVRHPSRRGRSSRVIAAETDDFGAAAASAIEMASFGSRSVSFSVRGPIHRDDLPGLSERVCALFAAHHDCVVECDVVGVPADAVTVEALARLQLVARRNECAVKLRNASAELVQLLAVLGLADIFAE